MSYDISLFIIYLAVLLVMAWPLGKYIACVYHGQNNILSPIFRPIEKACYRCTGIKDTEEMTWKEYALSLIIFNVLGMGLVYLLQTAQHLLPFNPQALPGVTPWHLAFNTAVSFMTNTNWQAYGGESTMSYFTQMAALTVQNFLSAATGMAVAVAIIRGFSRKSTATIGNYWVDMTRSVIYILLPLSVIFAVILVQQGVIQNLLPYQTVQTVEGGQQILAMGPVASQEAIKLLGTNGGGFFNANSAHPYENPTALTNFLECISIFLIPVALVIAFGYMVGNRRQGYALLSAMLLLFSVTLGSLYASEWFGNPILTTAGIASSPSMEGKEVRFGVAGSSLFATVTTAASCGAINSMHDSLTPLGGLVAMLQMMLGEVVVGGVGAGFYGMMMFALLTVFIVGLMVGRTPEYLGKKIEAREMKMATMAILIPAVTILIGSALSAVLEEGVSSIANHGPHGLSEILYAFASAAGNNGSAFGGLTVNTLFYNLILAVAMIIGRFGVIIPVLAIAGSMASKKISPPGPGTFATDGILFAILLAGIVIIVGALTFLPALALGPIVEHLLMLEGTAF